MTATSTLPPVTTPDAARPRSFVWFNWNGVMHPAIWFDDPRVGSALVPVAEHRLGEADVGLTLDELARKYPAPAMGGTD